MVRMFVSSRKSLNNLVHAESCCYAARIKKENRIVYPELTEALFDKKCYCPHCSLLYKEYSEEKEWIDNFVKTRDILIKFDEHGLSVKTPYGKWYICQEMRDSLSLYHANTKRGNNKPSIIKKYHSQEMNSNSMKEFFEYIYKHDMYRKDNPSDFLKPKTVRKAKTPAKKGTHRYEKEQRWNKRLEYRNTQKRLMFLFEKIELANA